MSVPWRGVALRGLCSAAALAAFFGSLGAQAPVPADESAAGRGFFQAGAIRLSIDELNADLTGSGLPGLSGDFYTLGGGGYGSRGRLLIGGEGHALLVGQETTTDGSRQISASGGLGLFRIGYLALSRRGLDVYPLLGIGGGGLNLKIIERSAPIFDDVLSDPDRSSSLSTGMFLLDAGLGLNYRLPGRRTDRGQGGFLIGVQLGYSFAPGRTSWMLDDINNVAGGPAFQIEGGYLRISIGGWGRADPE